MTIRDYAELWGVTLDARLPGSTSSEVWRGSREGRPVVLKLPNVDTEEAGSLPVLRAFAGNGGVEILEGDEMTGACLLPLLGSTLDEAEMSDEAQSNVFALLALGFRKAPLVEAMTYEIYAADAFSSDDSVLREPIRVIARLLETRSQTTLIHGDLHHFNILKTERDYVAIDPKGVATDPAAEIVAYVRNPRPEALNGDRVRQRIERVAEVWGESYDRLWAWAWAGNFVSFWWDEATTCEERIGKLFAT